MPAKIQYKPNEVIGNNKIIKEDIQRTQQKGRTFWICQCVKCGNIRSIRSDSLKRNKSCKKCNENKAKIKDDLTGRTFGFLTVIEKSQKPNYWLCYCNNCGSYKEVFRGNLTQGSTKSCGCIKSWGETQIAYWLNYYGINYKKEFIFKNLKTSKDGYPRFDFAVFDIKNNLFCVIEYNGRQHYNYDKNWKMTFENFQYLQEVDKLKEKYCKDNNIKMLILNENSNIKKEISNIYNSQSGNK